MNAKNRFQPIRYLGVRGIYGLLLCSAALLMPLPAIGAADLNQQLDIRINNGTRGTVRDRADQLVRWGGQAQYQGNLEKAIAYWMQAVMIYQQIGDIEAMGQTYDYISMAYAALGRYQEAEDALRQWLGLARTNKNWQGQVLALNDLGTLLLQRRELLEAKAAFEEALLIAQRVKYPAGEGLSLSNLGLVAAGQGHYYEAIALYENAISQGRRASDPLGEANTFNNLGDAYRAIGDYRNTINAYGTALRIAQASLDRPTQLRAIDNLVIVYGKAGNYHRAMELLTQRFQLVRQENDPYQELKSLRLLAILYQQSGHYREALATYHRIIQLASILGKQSTVSVLLYQLDEMPRAAFIHD